MNILIFTNLFPNASYRNHGSFIYERAARYVRKGHFVQVIAPVPYFPSSIQIPRWLRTKLPLSRWETIARIPNVESIRGIRVHHPRYCMVPTFSMPVHGMLMFLGSFFCAQGLHKIQRFDCIDAHYVYPDGFAAALLGAILRIPFVVTAHGSDICLYPSSHVLRPMISWTLRQAKAVVAVCASLKHIMSARLCIEPERIQVISNGVDTDSFFIEDKAEARGSLNLPHDATLAISVGALVPSKGHHRLIEAVPAVLAECPNFRLYLIGDGRTRSQLEKLIQRKGLSDNVFLVGEVDRAELRAWYSAADVMCLVSTREGCACVLLESLACGTPVIASAVGGTPELISSEAGVLVQGNPESIATGLCTAVRRDWNKQLIRMTVLNKTWDAVSEVLEGVLKAATAPDHYEHRKQALTSISQSNSASAKQNLS